MRNTDALLDKAKGLCQPATDYQLAKQLGISPQRLSNWRRQGQGPDADTAWKLAEFLHMEPQTVIAYVEEDRAKNPSVKARWRARLPRLLSALAIAAWVAGQGTPLSAEAGTAGVNNLYIMRTMRDRHPDPVYSRNRSRIGLNHHDSYLLPSSLGE